MLLLGRRAAFAAVLVVGSGFFGGNCAAQTLFEIPTDSPPAAVVADGQPLRILVHARDTAALARVLGVRAPQPGSDRLEYLMSQYPAIVAGRDRRWTEPTFVIDYREPSVATLSSELAASPERRAGLRASPRETLINYVGGVIHPSHNRGFDIASEVAAHRDGDCKAYAVLTVALARGAGIPARVALGLVVLRSEDHYAAFGHAWAELQVDGRWVVADAALQSTPSPARYLPFGVLEDEGMAYTLDVARLTPVWVQRVEILGGAVAASPGSPARLRR